MVEIEGNQRQGRNGGSDRNYYPAPDVVPDGRPDATSHLFRTAVAKPRQDESNACHCCKAELERDLQQQCGLHSRHDRGCQQNGWEMTAGTPNGYGAQEHCGHYGSPLHRRGQSGQQGVSPDGTPAGPSRYSWRRRPKAKALAPSVRNSTMPTCSPETASRWDVPLERNDSRTLLGRASRLPRRRA